MKVGKGKRVEVLYGEVAEAGKDLDFLVRSFLNHADDISRSNPKDIEHFDIWTFFHKVLLVEVPDLKKHWRRGTSFEILKNCSYFFTVRASLYPRVYEAKHGFYFGNHVIETSEHLIKRASHFEGLGDFAAVYEIDKILRKYTNQGLPSLPNVIAPDSAELDRIMRYALETFAYQNPGKFAKIFNEEALELGFFQHTKRNDALVALRKSLK